MMQCEFVLLVLDANATPFTRIWYVTLMMLDTHFAVPRRCCFEEAMYVEAKEEGTPLKLDIAAVCDPSCTAVVTGGLTPAEFELEQATTGAGYAAKQAREKEFPQELIERGLGIDITLGQASVRKDRQRILNTINEVSVDLLDVAETDMHTENIQHINARLRAIFAQIRLSYFFASMDHDGCTRMATYLAAAKTRELIMELGNGTGRYQVLWWQHRVSFDFNAYLMFVQALSAEFV